MRKIRGGTKPETKIQKAIIRFLKAKDWGVEETHGNMYQCGFPDLYAMHLRYGTRWIEVKVADKYRFTPAQLQKFPQWSAKGVGIWVLTEASDLEYKKLFFPANWMWYLPVMK